MKNEKHPRIVNGVFKLPAVLNDEINKIVANEHRTFSSAVYYLLIRGVKAYKADGLLIEERDELAFLEPRGTPVIQGRQGGRARRATG